MPPPALGAPFAGKAGRVRPRAERLGRDLIEGQVEAAARIAQGFI